MNGQNKTNNLIIPSPRKGVGQLEFSDMAGKSTKFSSPFGKTVLQFFININLSFNPAIPRLDIYPREMKMYSHSKTSMSMFVVTLCMITKNWKPHKCPLTNELVNKLWNTTQTKRIELFMYSTTIFNSR